MKYMKSYYCFLCNEYHENPFTKEHFIPKSINGLDKQWLPVCEKGNQKSNIIFDNNVRDILYMSRFQDTGVLKREGEALLNDGTLKQYKFAYKESKPLPTESLFQYFYDKKTSTNIPSEKIFAIKFFVGLNKIEQENYCRGLAKISIGSLVFLLKENKVSYDIIKQICSQLSIDCLRHVALNLNWTKKTTIVAKFSLGRSDIVEQLHKSCNNQKICNHSIQILFAKDNINIKGMLYSRYGWELNLKNNILINTNKPFILENPINSLSVQNGKRDLTLSKDYICVKNPKYKGNEPDTPKHWQNNR